MRSSLKEKYLCESYICLKVVGTTKFLPRPVPSSDRLSKYPIFCWARLGKVSPLFFIEFKNHLKNNALRRSSKKGSALAYPLLLISTARRSADGSEGFSGISGKVPSRTTRRSPWHAWPFLTCPLTAIEKSIGSCLHFGRTSLLRISNGTVFQNVMPGGWQNVLNVAPM